MQATRNAYQSQYSNEDFEQAQILAQSIGLTDHPPIFKIVDNAYISNIIPRKQRKRRLNYSDLLPYNKRKAANEVRQRKTTVGSQKDNYLKGIRKNSLKNVVTMKEAPEDCPRIFQKTQNIIHKNDVARARKFIEQSVQLRQISFEKQRRSGILKEVSVELFKEDETYIKKNAEFKSLTLGFSRKNPYFSGIKNLTERKNASKSQQKLAVSFDFNKFKVVATKDEYFIQNNNQKRIQTGSLKRSFRLEFNSNNRCEILCNQIDQAIQF